MAVVRAGRAGLPGGGRNLGRHQEIREGRPGAPGRGEWAGVAPLGGIRPGRRGADGSETGDKGGQERPPRQGAAHQAGSPTPRAIRAASRGMAAKPSSSMFRIQDRRPARASLTWGSSPLRSGIAQRM